MKEAEDKAKEEEAKKEEEEAKDKDPVWIANKVHHKRYEEWRTEC